MFTCQICVWLHVWEMKEFRNWTISIRRSLLGVHFFSYVCTFVEVWCRKSSIWQNNSRVGIKCTHFTRGVTIHTDDSPRFSTHMYRGFPTQYPDPCHVSFENNFPIKQNTIRASNSRPMPDACPKLCLKNLTILIS